MRSPTQHEVLWTSKLSLLAILLLATNLVGCSMLSQLEAEKEPTATFRPQEKVFFDSYANVWRATQIAVHKYQFRINNMDKGHLETETIKGFTGWHPPHKTKRARGGKRYTLSLRVIKGRIKGRTAIKVKIYKHISFQKDFFASDKRLPSDGLEEKVILYRIGRELTIERALKKAAR